MEKSSNRINLSSFPDMICVPCPQESRSHAYIHHCVRAPSKHKQDFSKVINQKYYVKKLIHCFNVKYCGKCEKSSSRINLSLFAETICEPCPQESRSHACIHHCVRARSKHKADFSKVINHKYFVKKNYCGEPVVIVKKAQSATICLNFQT